MALVLPSTVEELNFLQNAYELAAITSKNMYVKESDKEFENIPVERRYKREVSLPTGVDWNISDFNPYLNFEDNNIQEKKFEVIPEAQVVPEGELRQRCESYSSVSSSMDDKYFPFPNVGVKTYNTVCRDSGSTCSDHTYVTPTPTLFKDHMDAEETYQNLDTYFGQETHHTDTISSPPYISPVGSPVNDSNLDYSIMGHSYSASSNCSQESFSESVGLKRSASDFTVDDELFILNSSKRTCESPSTSRYSDSRKKNNMASKNCRKTRKEKQKEMEVRVTELEKEKEELKAQVQLLEELIDGHKTKLFAILQQRR